MKLLLIVALGLVCSLAAHADSYLGVSGALVLPQGGSRVVRVGGAALRGGHYLDENLALEGEAAWLEDAAGLAARGLWHWQGWQLYSDFFGYSPFDPFFTLGASGLLARRGHGQVGPEAGVGACYYLTDEWALRGEARATLGLDTEVEMLYGVSVGVQYSF